MPIDYGLGHASHIFFVVTVVLYSLAVLAYAGDFAFGRRQRAGADPAPVPAPELVAVGAGGGSTGGVGTPPAKVGSGGRDGRLRALPDGAWLRVALALTGAGLLAHIGGVVTRGLAVHRVPWGDMYEFVTAATCVAVIIFVALMIRYRVYRLGLFVMGPMVVLLGLAETVIYTPVGQLPPALQSYWLAIHVTAVTLAIGAFVVAAIFSVTYLLADRHEKRVAAGRPVASGAIFRQLPSAKVIDQFAYRMVVFGFPLWTFAIIAGAIWADEAWGRYWGWDPTETWAFITWVVYAGYLHARATAGWRGRKAAYIQLIGFGCLLFNIGVVSVFLTGLHSYAGLS